jgi:predicted small lipoprotein YifL
MMLQALQRHLRGYSFAGFGILAALMLLCASLAGCGSYFPSQEGQSQATPSPTQSEHAQNCGKVDVTPNGKPSDINQARLAGNCFWQAFQNCQAASLL